MGKAVSERVKVDLRGVTSLIKALTHSNNRGVKVGVLSERTARTDLGGGKVADTNAGIGLVHEFGSFSRHIPERSFIKMPLTAKAKDLMRLIQKLMEDKFKGGKDKKGPVKEVEEEMIDDILKKIGVAAEGIIMDAFKSGGFGRWPALKPRTIKAKGTDAILIDSTQLEGSISSAVANR